jgi:hypothetical protein
MYDQPEWFMNKVKLELKNKAIRRDSITSITIKCFVCAKDIFVAIPHWPLMNSGNLHQSLGEIRHFQK